MIKKILLWCSGANTSILSQKECLTEQNKYVSIGTTVLLTAIMASFSGGYALFTVFGSLPISSSFGAFWGIMIFNLDRFLILSTRKKKNDSFGQVKGVLPRLLLAIFLGVIISKPLELRLFEKEINQQIKIAQNQQAKDFKKNSPEQQEINNIKEQNKQLKADSDKFKQEWLKGETEANQEATGTSGTRKFGKGIVYEDKRKLADDLKKKMEEKDASIRENEKKISEKQEILNNKTNRDITNQNEFGLLKQLSTLESLGEDKDKAMTGRINLFITLLFVMIEISPVMVKLMSKYGTYDAILEKEEEAIIYYQSQELLDTKQEIKQEIDNRQKIRDNVREKTRQKLEDFLNYQFTLVLEKTIKSSQLAEIHEEVVNTIGELTKTQIMKQARLINIVGRDVEEELNKVKLETLKRNVSDKVNQAVTEAKVERFFEEDLKDFANSVNGKTANNN